MRDAIRIASIELKRSWRQFTTDRRQLLYIAFSLCILLSVIGAAFVLSNQHERLLRTSLIYVDNDFLSRQLFVLTLILVFIIFVRTIQSLGSPSAPELLLTTVSTTSVVLGTLIAESIRITLIIGIPLVIGSTIIAIETGAYILIPLISSIVPTLVCFAVVVGYAAGMFWKILVIRVLSSGKLLTLLRILGVISIFIAITFFTRILEWSYTVVELFAPLSPFTALINIAIFSTSQGADPSLETFISLSMIVVGLAILCRISIFLADFIWFSDIPQASEKRTSKSTGNKGTHIYSKITRTTRLKIAVTQWKRGQRNPHRFSHILYSGFVVLPALLPTESGSGSLQGLLLVLPPLFVIYVAWITGALFTLNPLGDEGPALVTLLTSPIDGSLMIHGKILAGLGGGIPLLVVSVGGTGFLGPLRIQQIVVLIGSGLLLSLYATTVAVGLGAFSPQFQESKVLTGRSVILPSTTTLSIYSLLVAPSSVLFLLLIFIPRALRLLPPFTTFTGQSLQLYGLPILVAWFIISGGICYQYAVRRSQHYRYV